MKKKEVNSGDAQYTGVHSLSYPCDVSDFFRRALARFPEVQVGAREVAAAHPAPLVPTGARHVRARVDFFHLAAARRARLQVLFFAVGRQGLVHGFFATAASQVREQSVLSTLRTAASITDAAVTTFVAATVVACVACCCGGCSAGRVAVGGAAAAAAHVGGTRRARELRGRHRAAGNQVGARGHRSASQHHTQSIADSAHTAFGGATNHAPAVVSALLASAAFVRWSGGATTESFAAATVCSAAGFCRNNHHGGRCCTRRRGSKCFCEQFQAL